MFRPGTYREETDRPAGFREGLRRRDLLQAGALAGLTLGLSDLVAVKGAVAAKDVNCIMLCLVGGPSHLDTWDMKPDAPSDIRGPFRPIKTNIPDIEISEIFPRMAKHADKYAIVRSVYHTAPAVHDTGHQLMQTGRLFEDGIEHPHIGCVLAKFKGPRNNAPAHVLLPGPIGHTGGNMPHGQNAGFLGKDFDPFVASDFGAGHHLESQSTRERYGLNRFGQSCLTARRMIEAGACFVTVNMFDTVFNEITWDIHGYRPFSPLNCYRNHVGPMFDMAYSSLLDDLHQRGLLSTTMVVAIGEFGRSPKINAAGGRDHWPLCSSMLMAGGPLKGGQVVGSSDATGSAPKDRPVTHAEIAATIYCGLGVPLDAELPLSNGTAIPVVDRDTEPIRELFG